MLAAPDEGEIVRDGWVGGRWQACGRGQKIPCQGVPMFVEARTNSNTKLRRAPPIQPTKCDQKLPSHKLTICNVVLTDKELADVTGQLCLSSLLKRLYLVMSYLFFAYYVVL
jgi:hypothetical protein